MKVNFLNFNLYNNIAKTSNNKIREYNTFSFKGNKLEDYDKYEQSKTNPQTAFLYDSNLDDETVLKLVDENKDVIWTNKEFAQRAGIDLGNVAFLTENGIIKEVRRAKKIYFDSLDEVNQNFFKNSKNWVSKKAFIDKYNYTKDEMNEEIEYGYLVCVVEDKGSCLSNFIDIENPQNQETLKRHFKIKPMQSKYLFRKPENEQNYVPALYLAAMGFGPVKSIVEAIDDGSIDGFAKRIITDGKKKIRCGVDINSQKSLAALAKIRYENPDIMEISELKKKLSMTKEEILEAIRDDELEIIPEYIFIKEKRKLFFDLTTEKNKAFVEKRQDELNRQ